MIMSLYDTILYLIATLIGALQTLTLYHKTKTYHTAP